MTQLLIHPEKVARANQRLASFQRRAIKLGQTFSYEVRPASIVIPSPFNQSRYVERVQGAYLVDFDTPMPRIAGHTLIATIVDEAGVILMQPTHPSYGEQYLEALKGVTPGRCDHCHTHRDRNIAYVVRKDETDAISVIGSSCIKDFLRSEKGFGPFLNLINAINEDDTLSGEEFGSCSYSGPAIISLQMFTSIALADVDARGYQPRREGGPLPTADLVWMACCPAPANKDAKAFYEREVRPLLNSVTEEHHGRAGEVIEWARQIEGNSTFAEMVRRVAEAGVVTLPLIGFAAGIVPGYTKDIDRAEARAREEEAKAALTGNNRHLGTVGERTTFTLAALLMHRRFDSHYGDFHIAKLATTDGAVVVLKGSYTKALSAILNATRSDNVFETPITLTATIKEHGEYEGEVQTVLQRPAIK